MRGLRWLRAPGSVLGGAVLLSFVVAVLATLILEVLSTGWPLPDDSPVREHLGLFFLGVTIVWAVTLLVLAITGRLWLTTSIVIVGALALGYSNKVKLELRVEPLYPTELSSVKEVGFLTDVVGLRTVLLGAGAALLVVGAGLLLGHFADKVFPRPRWKTHPRLTVALVPVRIGIIALTTVLLVQAAHFNTPGNQIRAEFERSGAAWRFWNQAANYRVNGFVGGMLYNTAVPGMDEPPGYSEAEMARIAREYAEVAARINQGREATALDDVNVVMVLSETLSDPTRLKGITVPEDPIPYTRALMGETTSGNMLSGRFGGGTANVEFSALTGMSLSLFQPQMNTPYQMMLPGRDHFPSLLDTLEETGHRTVAIHPFTPSMYRRSTAYDVLGFDETRFADQMDHRDTVEDNEYISDRAAFEETLEVVRDTEEPVFVNLVTMQNHYPMRGKYEDPLPIEGLTGEAAEDASAYLRGLRYSDEALRSFLAALSAGGEPTVVLLYGDHLPAFWPVETRMANGFRKMRETPFLVWSNLRSLTPRPLPTTSPTFFGPLVLNHVGARLSPFDALLTQLHRHVPAMEPLLRVGPNGNRLDGPLSPTAARLLADYRLMQYDMSVGAGYAEDQLTQVVDPEVPFVVEPPTTFSPRAPAGDRALQARGATPGLGGSSGEPSGESFR